jgi:hypothetical protein
MGSTQSPFYSTPAFELFRRGLLSQTIKRFRGINAYHSLTRVGPEFAIDLLNVLVSGSGVISKLRLPITLSPSVGPAVGPNSFWDFQQGNGTRQVLANFGNSLYNLTADLSVATLIETTPGNIPPWSFAIANNIAFGANGVRMQKWTGVNWQAWGHPTPAAAPGVVVLVGTLSPLTGFLWGYAYKNSITGHVGSVSLFTPQSAPGNLKGYRLTALPPPDPQIDTIVWFRTLDGGGDLFRLSEVNLVTGVVTLNSTTIAVVAGTNNLQIIDNTPDGTGGQNLDLTQRAPLINNPPVQGRYVAVGQSRVIVFNLIGSPQDAIYSGYEQILIGRPEESFPPNNRLRLSIGAESIAGGGIIQAGIVVFSQTGRMYMLRGALEDITINAPVQFTSFLEELPWTLGCLSHFTIQSTPYGLIWLAGDKTVQLFDGSSAPSDISGPIYPILRTITPGTESQCVGGYFNWLERDWYSLTCAVGGSLTPNRIFFFSLDKSTQEIDIFISTIQADFIGVITTSKLQRMLCIGQSGRIKQLPISDDTVGGITQDLTIIPATSGQLSAFWRGGYFGNDSPQRNKAWAWGKLITDQNPASFQITMRHVDDNKRLITAPEIIGPKKLSSAKFSVRRRSNRLSIEINFPSQDVSANVMELTMSAVPTSDR